jgi:membrane protein YqaA with SNARE-associated domain
MADDETKKAPPKPEGRRKVKARFSRRVTVGTTLAYWTKITYYSVVRVLPGGRKKAASARKRDGAAGRADHDADLDYVDELGVKETFRHRLRRTLLKVVPGSKSRSIGADGGYSKKQKKVDEDLEDLGVRESLRYRVKRKLKVLAVWAGVGVAVVILFSLFKQDLIDLLRKNSVTWATYTHISEQVEQKTLLGLGYAGFFGALFFIMIPLEAIFFYYLALDHSPFMVITIMQVASVLGLTADYLMGSMVGERTLLKFAAEKFKKTEEAMENWGGIIVLVCNVIPFLPIQIISLAIGSTRFGAVRFLILTFLGRLIYLLGLFYFADSFKAIFM